ncbi:MAG: methylenetetrahydrofolate reductase [NAD(P)H] [Bacillota bacterium]|nr:methylenetetrahydrofolate reductase [NAD(P)H] [Bacillota bacterium]
MKISTLFNSGKPVFSFEVFPPKKTSSIEMVYNTIDSLKKLHPDYISVTFGAGGTGVQNATVEIASKIKNTYGIEALAHITCVGSCKAEIDLILNSLLDNNIENILALRGDLHEERPFYNDFPYACDLISYIKKSYNFDVSAACYPEKHLEAKSMEADLQNLKRKVDNGATNLISQLFFDNNSFYSFLEQAEKIGIKVPIQAGIMPIMNKNQIERMVTLCGATLTPKIKTFLEKYENNPEDLKKVGIEYAAEQINDLLQNHVDGIHLYTMNQSDVAEKICQLTGRV